VFICLELHCDEDICTYGSGEKDWNKHDAVTALVTYSKPTAGKFHWPKTLHCAIHWRWLFSIEWQDKVIMFGEIKMISTSSYYPSSWPEGL